MSGVPDRTGKDGLNTERRNMMTTTNFYVVAKPLQADQGLKERPRVARRQSFFIGSKVETEPETRLWKVCAKAGSSRLSSFEWIAFLLLGASALGALACCFSEAFHSFNTGALDQTVRALLTS
jgi:hypothetical protein